MKKSFLVLACVSALAACTTDDTYWKPDVGLNNVGTYNSDEKASGSCTYVFGIKTSNDCSPDKIANEYGIKTITEVNSQKLIFPLLPISSQKTTIQGISK